jgi:hypothetical protein
MQEGMQDGEERVEEKETVREEGGLVGKGHWMRGRLGSMDRR